MHQLLMQPLQTTVHRLGNKDPTTAGQGIAATTGPTDAKRNSKESVKISMEPSTMSTHPVPTPSPDQSWKEQNTWLCRYRVLVGSVVR
jgi:hypothetical protein